MEDNNGLVVVPVFHCPKCLACWKSTRNLPENCIEEAKPTRGDPIALDSMAGDIFLDEEKLNMLQVHQRRGVRGSIKPKVDLTRRKTLQIAYGYKNKADTAESHADFDKDKEELIEKGIRKYGGLNKSAAEMFVQSSRGFEKKSRDSLILETDIGYADSKKTDISNGLSNQDYDRSRILKIKDATMEINKSKADEYNGINNTNAARKKNMHKVFRDEEDKNMLNEDKNRSVTIRENKANGNGKPISSDAKKDSHDKGLINVDEKNILLDVDGGKTHSFVCFFLTICSNQKTNSKALVD